MSDASTKKRERIMMSLAGLAVIYLLITFLLPSGKKEDKPATGAPAAVDMLATISQGMDSITDKETTRAAEVLALAARPWQDALLSPAGDFAGEPGATANDTQAPAALAYTGYMGMAKGRLAIINGKDYQQGDRVEGFVVQEITPAAVVLEKNGATLRVNIQAPME